MRPTIKMALDVGVEEPTNGISVQQPGDRLAIDFAVMIIDAAQIDQHVAVAAVVACAPHETAAVDIGAFERSEVHFPSIFHVRRFRTRHPWERCNECYRETRGAKQSSHWQD